MQYSLHILYNHTRLPSGCNVHANKSSCVITVFNKIDIHYSFNFLINQYAVSLNTQYFG